MTCLTLSTSTAYCKTDKTTIQIRMHHHVGNICDAQTLPLASNRQFSLAGTRESEQPIHKYSGRLLPDTTKNQDVFLIDSAQLRRYFQKIRQ